MVPREPLPRGPVTYAEEQTAQLIGEVRETNRLLGQILSHLQTAPGSTDLKASIGGALTALGTPSEESLRAMNELGIQMANNLDATKDAENPVIGPFPDREVKPRDRPGAAPRKRPGRS